MPNPLAIFNLYRRLIMTVESSTTGSILIDTTSWVASLPVTLAVYQSGTPKGHSLAKQNLQRMAEVADLAIRALRIIDRMASDEHVRGDDVTIVLAEAKRLSNARPCDNTPEHHAAPSPDGDAARACGALAKKLSNLDLPIDICYCARGYFIGTYDDGALYTRESEEYWPQRDQAVTAMRTGDWTQRVAP
jgi:hypothetical protein